MHLLLCVAAISIGLNRFNAQIRHMISEKNFINFIILFKDYALKNLFEYKNILKLNLYSNERKVLLNKRFVTLKVSCL